MFVILLQLFELLRLQGPVALKRSIKYLTWLTWLMIHANCDCTRSGSNSGFGGNPICNDGTMAWRRFPCYWPFVRGIHRGKANFLHKGKLWGSLCFLLCKGFSTNNRVAADSRRHDPHVTSLKWSFYGAISTKTYHHPISVIWWSISVSCLFQFHTCIT